MPALPDLDITIIRGSSKGCLVFYKGLIGDEPGPAYYIKRYPTVDMNGKVQECDTWHRGVDKIHTTSKFEFRRIELEPGAEMFEMDAIARAAEGKLMKMSILHPVPQQGAGNDESTLDAYDAINSYLHDTRKFRWWIEVQGETKGGNLQRQMLAYALAVCPMCE